MKTNWTIFFDKGIMKGFKEPEKPLHLQGTLFSSASYIEALKAARLSALPVSDESKFDVINDLAAQAAINERLTYEQFIAWQPDQTKEYAIACEFILENNELILCERE